MKSKIIYFFLILIILSKGYIFTSKYNTDEKSKEYTIFIESLKDVTESKVSYNVRIGEDFKDKCILNIYKDKYSKEESKKDLKDFASFNYADVIKVKGKFSKAELLNNPGEFNYKLYLYSNNIHGTIAIYTTTDVEKVEYTKTIYDRFVLKVNKLKKQIDASIKQEMSDDEANLTKALVYGEMDNLDEEILENFQNVGVSHLMSVSGSHMASFMLIVNFVLQSKKKEQGVKNIVKNIVVIILVMAYCIFCGFSVSVVRSGIMVITNVVSSMCIKNKNKDKYLGLKIAFFCILLNCPFAIFNIGTELSFLSVLGIMFFKEFILENLQEVFKFNNRKRLKKILKPILEGISLSLAVQLLIFPIQFSSFNKISFPLIISNLLIGYLSNVIRITGSIGVLFVFSDKISSVIFSFLFPISKLTIYVVELLNKISFSITTKTMPVIFFVIYYTFVLALYVFLKLKSVCKNVDKLKMKYNLVKIKKIFKYVVLVMLLLLIILAIVINIYSKYFSCNVYFFNVKQGDMSYIKYKNEGIVIDVGSLTDNLAFNILSNFFKSENMSKVDLVVISHMHKDHINGFEKLAKNYNIEQVIYAHPLEETENFKNFIKIVEENNITAKSVKAGEMIKLKNITIKILLPDNNYILDDAENANSLVCKVTAGKKNMLYMGDANVNSEEKLLTTYPNIGRVDILKVGHHGSKTATSEKFVANINPQYAVISASKKYYGHPHQNTLDTLSKYNIFVFMTETRGCIKFNLN